MIAEEPGPAVTTARQYIVSTAAETDAEVEVTKPHENTEGWGTGTTAGNNKPAEISSSPKGSPVTTAAESHKSGVLLHDTAEGKDSIHG